MKSASYLLAVILLFWLTPASSQENIIRVDFAQKGTVISPSMYGVFFEEINHAGDGGLYAEMIQNRSFEDKVVPATCKVVNGYLVPPQKPNYLTGTIGTWKMPWDTINKWPGWSIKKYGTAMAISKLTTSEPLTTTAPTSMEINITKAQPKEQIELINEGFWGIAVQKGEKYNLRFYLKVNKEYTGMAIAKLRSAENEIIDKQDFAIKSYGTWNEYSYTFTAKKSDSKAAFVLGFTAKGKVWVDYVSMFPEKTFKNRKNGLRNDVAQMIANLKPGFVRWPGGCIVEGLTLENRVKWKETLGDPMTRPGVFDLWGYRNSCGFGYYEYLQFCEDIGASGMFVCNAGFSCAYRNGDYCTEEEVPAFIQDALDAIEYAIGDTTTVWGKKRALQGHPTAFPLKYIEVGNENYGEIYAKRFNAFYKAIKEKYPQITVISTIEDKKEMGLIDKTDLFDPHFYKSPRWFYLNANLFDNYQRWPTTQLYVGEYACNQGVGNGNMDAALSEASFMIGMERNSDLVRMCSYAPLLENSNARNWPVNLIWINNHKTFGRSSYYIQKIFSENRPSRNLSTVIHLNNNDLPKQKYEGLIGLGTEKTQSVYKDFTVTKDGKTFYKADFANNQNDWEPAAGHWRVEGEEYIQGDLEEHRCTFVRNKTFENCTIEVKAKKIKGAEGFNLLFGGIDYVNYYQLSIGKNGGAEATIDKVEGGIAMPVTNAVSCKVEENRWYTLKVTISGDEVECWVDGTSILKYKIKEISKRFAIAGLDEAKNEIVIKVVNAESVPFQTSIKLENSGEIDPKGQIITINASDKTDENTFKNPTKIYPQQEEYKGFSNDFRMEFKPYSLTVLRIRKK